jgi:small subunit ribosomal protein S4
VVRHGHVDVNGRKVNIPSYQVQVGDVVSIREASKKIVTIQGAEEFHSGLGQPGWLEIDREGLKGKLLSLPKREDIQLPVNEQLIVELYSK